MVLVATGPGVAFSAKPQVRMRNWGVSRGERTRGRRYRCMGMEGGGGRKARVESISRKSKPGGRERGFAVMA